MTNYPAKSFLFIIKIGVLIMFDFVKGILVDKNYPYCTVENSGMGYRFLVCSRVLSQIGEINSEVKIYSRLIHKEDSMFLCGFKTKQERIIFDILTNVSGVGVKVAFALFDEFEINELIEAVLNEDYKQISRAKGVGSKMAQKIVLEIKDKLTKIELSSEILVSKIDQTKISAETIKQTTTILQSLGYNPNEYNLILEKAVKTLEKDDSQELLKETLKMLSLT